jgi:hypothetical protein
MLHSKLFGISVKKRKSLLGEIILVTGTLSKLISHVCAVVRFLILSKQT